MPPVPILSGKQVIEILNGNGFEAIRQRGSHVRMRHPDGRRTTVPLHKELDRGTLRAIIRQTGLTVDDFVRQ
jgi:predicted RNA binding protein YcfA (HicA-like mRNA interferase family)